MKWSLMTPRERDFMVAVVMEDAKPEDRDVFMMEPPTHEYTKDISLAWKVVEKMLEKRFSYKLDKYYRNHHCEFIGWRDCAEEEDCARKQIVVEVECATAPQAICKAFLIAMEVPIE